MTIALHIYPRKQFKMILTIKQLLTQLQNAADTVEFDAVMAIITEHYHYQQTDFTNGKLLNKAGSNEGSCKIFAFAKVHQLTEQATLQCFGRYYREDVLNNPSGDDHGNIRTFIKNGWAGISFSGKALTTKS